MSMIISYIIGFFAIFVANALYNSKCKAGEEVNMNHVVIASLVWPITLTVALLAIIWDALGKVFNSISKK